MLAVLRLVVVGTLLALPGLAFAAKTFGLVIGINDYAYVPTLDGARSDAADISSALSRMGVENVTTLLDRDATKQNVVAAWQSMLAQARSGDTLFISYAGHGAQAPERNAGEEKDKLDEFWVLPGFNPQNIRETWHETVFDNELNTWFKDASSRGLHVVFVSDSCHAGGMDRAVNGRMRYVDVGKSRILGELVSLMLKGQGGQAPQPEQSVLPANVTLLAATGETLPVPEVVIDGRPRGALSWSVARALEGMADRDGDGVLTRTELEDYILATVRMRSESLQTPVFTPVSAQSGREIVIALRQDQSVQVASQPEGQGAQRPVPMARELGFKPILTVSVKGSELQPENTVKGRYSYEWDATKGIFKTPNGDVAGENISSYTVNDVVSKFILVDFLQAVASKKPGKSNIAPQKTLYYEGERIKFDSARGAFKNMLVFNLANTGEVQFLDMISNGDPTNKTFLKEMQVVAPFGADHLVTISTNAPLDYIGEAIERGVGSKELLQLLSSRIDGVDAEVSVTPLYTRSK
jgi:hypothetical protein